MAFEPKHILVPVAIDPEDDFKLAEHAVFAACDIAEKFASRITLLHLAPMVSPGGSAAVDISGKVYQSFMLVLQARIERGRLKLKELQDVAKKRGITVEGRVVDSLENTPAVICATADEVGADLLVIGSHGRRGLSKMFFGSVAEQVVQKSKIPVLLLHPVKDEG